MRLVILKHKPWHVRWLSIPRSRRSNIEIPHLDENESDTARTISYCSILNRHPEAWPCLKWSDIGSSSPGPAVYKEGLAPLPNYILIQQPSISSFRTSSTTICLFLLIKHGFSAVTFQKWSFPLPVSPCSASASPSPLPPLCQTRRAQPLARSAKPASPAAIASPNPLCIAALKTVMLDLTNRILQRRLSRSTATLMTCSAVRSRVRGSLIVEHCAPRCRVTALTSSNIRGRVPGRLQRLLRYSCLLLRRWVRCYRLLVYTSTLEPSCLECGRSGNMAPSKSRVSTLLRSRHTVWWVAKPVQFLLFNCVLIKDLEAERCVRWYMYSISP